jgi:50S ribosomal subunit-associated GTPase HflX
MARRIVAGAEHAVESVGVSAHTGEGVEKLLAAIDRLLALDPIERASFRIPSGEGAELSYLHEHGRVLETRYEGDVTVIDAEVPQSAKRRLQRYLSAED